MLICPVIIGGGKPALPRDVRAELELVDERRFTDGVVYPATASPSEPSTPWVHWTAGSR
jgi:hypothetical protein